MAGQDSNDKIAELLKQACPPAAASPEFKAELRQNLSEQAAALGTQSPSPLWQQPFVWIPAAAAAAVAVVLIIYFVAFHSAPLTVTTSDATGIQTTAAILNGNLDNLGVADNVQVAFEWGTGTDYGNETASEVRTADGSVQADLSGLAPKTTYHFRLKVVGSHGAAYGPDVEFTTGPEPPLVTTSEAIKVKTDSATLRGSLDDMGSAASVSVSFEWGLMTSYGNETALESRTEAGEYDAELSGLSPDTTYHFRAKAVGDDTTYGADVEFTTESALRSVETKEAAGIGAYSARLNGELTSLGTAGSAAVSFVWGTTSGGPYTQTSAAQVRTERGAFSADASGLSPGVIYYYKARADGDGGPVYGGERSLVTLTAPPSVTTSSGTEVHARSVILNGILDTLGTAWSVEVYFEWGLTTEYGSQTTRESRAIAGSFNATLTGLSSNTTYHFRARAVGHGGALGADMMFTTGSASPEQKTWYLCSDNSDPLKTMFDGDASKPTGEVIVGYGGASYSQVWRADQPSGGTAYPAGVWVVDLALNHLNGRHGLVIEIGTWNEGVFDSQGTYSFVAQGEDNNSAHIYEAKPSVGSFTVPSGGYVAARITVTTTYNQRVDVQVGGSQSYMQSPSYPETMAPTVATNAVTSVGQVTATLSGYLDNLGTAGSVTVWFEWGTTTEYGNQVEVGSLTSSGDFAAVLADLDPNTTYHFRAKAIGDGTNCGVDMTFTTPP